MEPELPNTDSLSDSLADPFADSLAAVPSAQEVGHEVGLAGLVERQLTRYIHADRQVLPASGLYDRVLAEVERPLLRVVLALVNGNKIKAAQILGLNRNTLLKKLRLHGLVPPTSSPKRRRKARVS